jgi:hypothetical protein
MSPNFSLQQGWLALLTGMRACYQVAAVWNDFEQQKNQPRKKGFACMPIPLLLP